MPRHTSINNIMPWINLANSNIDSLISWKKTVIESEEIKSKLLESQQSRIDVLEDKVNALIENSNCGINKILIIEINKLRAENDELKNRSQ